jgi:hypothetical protein
MSLDDIDPTGEDEIIEATYEVTIRLGALDPLPTERQLEQAILAALETDPQIATAEGVSVSRL